MAKILLVDTNFSSAPIYRSLMSAGHEVHVVGGNPADCLAKIAPRYWCQDYSDIDALARLVDSQKFDFLVPGCTDRSYASCLAVGQGRFPGFDSAEVAATINHKARFRQAADQMGLPVPRLHANADANLINGPVIVKPVDAYSGKGITVLRHADAATFDESMNRACEASPTGSCLIEDYVEGQLYSYSAFLLGQRVMRSFLVQEDSTVNQFVVDTSRVLEPASHERLVVALQKDVETLAMHLGLADGLLHTQFIDNGENHWLIELTRRCPGDLYSQLIELSTGFPYTCSYTHAFLGQGAVQPVEAGLRPVMRHTVTVPARQNLDHVRFRRAVTIERYVSLSLVGDALEPSPQSRVGILFCLEDDQLALDGLYETALRRELYTVSDGSGPM